ncbi:hypothetical protein SUDANB58_05272 [Streptomyces sp. enrichment culture]|uniref:hypothetical protein n=1 Tax=Streptomyces sp. enrichment culture TaxID=1795815 RepID=UPI003F57EEC1
MSGIEVRDRAAGRPGPEPRHLVDEQVPDRARHEGPEAVATVVPAPADPGTPSPPRPGPAGAGGPVAAPCGRAHLAAAVHAGE